MISRMKRRRLLGGASVYLAKYYTLIVSRSLSLLTDPRAQIPREMLVNDSTRRKSTGEWGRNGAISHVIRV